MKYLIGILFIFGSLFVSAQNEQNEQKIKSAFAAGNYREISKHFGSNVELSIRGENKVYSKVQAELVIKDFLKRNIPSDFNILHRGTSKSGINYFMGKLVTQKKQYQVSVYFKKENNNLLINRVIIDD